MKLTKQTIAVVLTAVLTMALFAGCQKSTSGATLLGEDGKPIEVEKVASIDGEPVSLEEFRYYFLSSKSYYDQMLTSSSSTQEDLWNDNPELLDMLKEQSLQAIKESRVMGQYAAKLGVTLDEDDQANIDAAVSDAQEEQGGEKEFDLFLAKNYLDRELYRSMLESNMLLNKLQNFLASAESPYAPNETEIKQYFEQNFLHAKHVLIMTQGITDEAELAAKQETANDIAKRARDGEDFDSLVQEYGEDPGMVQSPDGYYFGEGEMVTEFYEGTKALAINGISEPVQTSYGLHVIQRLPLEEAYFNEHKDEISQKIVSTVSLANANLEIEAALDACVVEKDPSFDLIGADNLL